MCPWWESVNKGFDWDWGQVCVISNQVTMNMKVRMVGEVAVHGGHVCRMLCILGSEVQDRFWHWYDRAPQGAHSGIRSLYWGHRNGALVYLGVVHGIPDGEGGQGCGGPEYSYVLLYHSLTLNWTWYSSFPSLPSCQTFPSEGVQGGLDNICRLAIHVEGFGRCGRGKFWG